MIEEPILDVNVDKFKRVLTEARTAGADPVVVHNAEQLLLAKQMLHKDLLRMLMRLELSPFKLADRGIKDIQAVLDANEAHLREAVGDEGTLQLRDLAQRMVVLRPGTWEITSAMLTTVREVGRGASSTVYEVKLSGELLALKKMNLSGQDREELLRIMRREFRTLQQLSHKNIVEQRGLVVDELNSVGLLMEVAPHGSLRALLDSAPTRVVGIESVQLQVASGIAAAMAFMHSQPVLHHDLKSANILLFDPPLTPKVTDFGLAVSLSNDTSTQRTMRAGAGTFAYKAPEQFDDEFSRASEVYSYAIVLWELLHGGRPWQGKAEAVIMRAVDRGQRPLVSVAPCVLVALMEDCWKHHATDRPHFLEVQERLDCATRTLGMSKFKRLYSGLVQDTRQSHVRQGQLLESVRNMIVEYAERCGGDTVQADKYFETVQRNALTTGGAQELVTEVDKIAVRMYTTAEKYNGIELCGILNKALREDQVEHAVVLTRVLNGYCVTGRQDGSQPVRPLAGRKVYRGGSFDPKHRHFFVPEKAYRVPMFLSTSCAELQARNFILYKMKPHLEPILWTIKLDPRGCKHVNFIDRHDGTLHTHHDTPAENEFLFAPYSAFTIQSVLWQDVPTAGQPHEVVLRAVYDNLEAPEDLPLAPWA